MAISSTASGEVRLCNNCWEPITATQCRVVTLCSHIFCYGCSQKAFGSDQTAPRASCPSCHATLDISSDINAVETRSLPANLDQLKLAHLGMDPLQLLSMAQSGVKFQ